MGVLRFQVALPRTRGSALETDIDAPRRVQKLEWQIDADEADGRSAGMRGLGKEALSGHRGVDGSTFPGAF
jgi:hypothetical protein